MHLLTHHLLRYIGWCKNNMKKKLTIISGQASAEAWDKFKEDGKKEPTEAKYETFCRNCSQKFAS